MGAYDDIAPKLVKLGYRVVPIAPGTKKPGRFTGSGYVDFVGWNDPNTPIETSPQPGAGIGVPLGKQLDGTWLSVLDWDSDGAFMSAMDIPSIWSPVQKVGQNGGTTFHRTLHEIPSRDFKINGKMAVQVLSTGKQTVLPPSIHPRTNAPYFYGDDRATLEMCKPSELPLLTDNYIGIIEEILRPLGYEPEPERPAVNGNGHDHDACDEFQILNNAALANLPAWVPGLGLYNCKRQRGSYPSYRAVASFRESLTPGKGLEERETHLLITGKCIKDFAENKGYSPIQLAMVALRLDFGAAVDWLKDKLTPGRERIEIAYDALKSADTADQPKQDGTDAKTDAPKARKLRFKLTRWCDMRPGTEQTYLVDELIPVKGIVVIWSPPKSFKSFVALDICLHVVKGWEYHDRSVQQGLVVYCAFEGGHGFDKRIEAQRRHYGLEGEDLPMPVLKGMANLITDHKLMVHEIAYQLKTDYGGVKPVAVVLDTLNRSFVGSESKDVDMANYVRAAEAIREAFDCVCVIIHHCGWDESRPRGHSSLPAAVDAQLSLVRDGDRATLTVEYMRDGVEGTQVNLVKKDVVIGEDVNGKEKTSLVMIRGDEAAVSPGGAKPKGWPTSLKVFRAAIAGTMVEHGVNHKISDLITVRAVEVGKVRDAFFTSYAVDSGDGATREQVRDVKRKAFSRSLEKAQGLNLIASQATDAGQLIWIALGLGDHAENAWLVVGPPEGKTERTGQDARRLSMSVRP